ncbi:aminotransferase [Paraliobacillus quinghaiensis]|uniref:cysteine-S-conjugate beta-lyase n=1 Tax=Paraliobacillus quinghaiensis TaxID=470815 RepID=A0A917TT87_9BACI|nr:MalY/PatB family protein [Paraliobacillus quinghaiensis]GGM37095.1 aminotransferase [Paraliobacillus quinghaiensis]
MSSLFDELPARKDTRSVKWDMVKALYGTDDVQPMWVADMDLPIANPIKQALVDRAEHAIFGYTYTDKLLNQIVRQWLQKQHDWDIKSDWIIYSPGVISTLHMAVLNVTKPGDSVLIQTPVYPPFYDIVKSHDRDLVTNPLRYENGYYTIDFEDLESKFQQGVKAFILCNPHNPVGRVWTKEELQKITSLCLQYDVMILSDEIHADLIYNNHKHIPIASLSDKVSEQTITCMSPTKTFNLAGLQVSYAIVPNKDVRDAMKNEFKKYGMTMLNTMGITALEAAYTSGEEWLRELLQLLEHNRDLVVSAFQDHPEITAMKAEGTYLIWLDCTDMGLSHAELKKFMQEKAKIGLNDGASFGIEGEGFMRMNIASPTNYVQEGVNKILKALDNRN